MEPQDPKTEKPLSNRERAAIKDELISELVRWLPERGRSVRPRGGIHSPQGRPDAAPAGGRDDRAPRARAQRAA